MPIAPADPRHDTDAGIVRFTVSKTAEPVNCIPALAAFLIAQWRERKAAQQAAQEEGHDDE